ncbi:MAG TPA: hypothetical protein VNV66_20025 [Pilimelia sp.]|nr:hypothetical protein [Pilimelia sp.]
MTPAPPRAGVPATDHPGTGFLAAHHHEIARLQRGIGRAALSPALQQLLADLHDARTGEPDEITLLLTRPFSRRLAIPEYYRYTCLHVYQWFLDQGAADPLPETLLALYATLRDLRDVEGAAWPPAARPGYIGERIALLDTTLTRLRRIPTDRAGAARLGDSIDRLLVDPDLRRRAAVLAECTRFPRSDQQEEYVFLRVVQACECLFFLVRHAALETLAAAHRDVGTAAWHLDRAADFAALLSDALAVLRTMSPEGFMTFREATGSASAVQSMNYHAMDIAVYGYDARKAEIFAAIPHLAELNTPDVRDHPSLAATLAWRADPRLSDGWQRFDRLLSRWRGAHYRFARTYLSSDVKASGGTEGAGYVKRFVRREAVRPEVGPRPAEAAALRGFRYL